MNLPVKHWLVVDIYIYMCVYLSFVFVATSPGANLLPSNTNH